MKGSLFEQEFGAEFNAPPHNQTKIMEALEKTKSNPKSKDGATEIKGFINSVKGLLTYQLEILPTVAEVRPMSVSSASPEHNQSVCCPPKQTFSSKSYTPPQSLQAHN